MFRALAIAFAGFLGFSAYAHRDAVVNGVSSVQQRVLGGSASGSIGACHRH
jgi:hypothetical protein